MASGIHKHEYRVRDIPTRAVTLFASRAQVSRDIKNVPLKPGINEIIIVGLTPTIDEQSIKVEGTGSAIITDIAVESLPNREIFEEIYPDSDDDNMSTDADSDSDLDEAPAPVCLNDIPVGAELQAVRASLICARDEGRRTDESIANAESRQKWLDSYYKTISDVGGFGEKAAKEIDVEDAMETYETERAKVFAVHMAGKIKQRKITEDITALVKEETKLEKERTKELKIKEKELQKVLKIKEKACRLKEKEREKESRKKAEKLKEKTRVRMERESFWPKSCFTVRIKLDAVDYTPMSSRRSSFAGDVIQAAPDKSPVDDDGNATGGNGSCDLSLTYVTAYAFWSPKYDLQLSTTNNTGLLCFDAELTNLTSEKWADCKVTLSTSQTTTTSLNEAIPTLVPWHVKLAGRHAALGNNLDGSPNGDIFNSREERQHKQSWQQRNNLVNVVQKTRGELFGSQTNNIRFGSKGASQQDGPGYSYNSTVQTFPSQGYPSQQLTGMPPAPPQAPAAGGIFATQSYGAGGQGMETIIPIFSVSEVEQARVGPRPPPRLLTNLNYSEFGGPTRPSTASAEAPVVRPLGQEDKRDKAPQTPTNIAFVHRKVKETEAEEYTIFHHICAQTKYEEWSPEELRLADYGPRSAAYNDRIGPTNTGTIFHTPTAASDSLPGVVAPQPMLDSLFGTRPSSGSIFAHIKKPPTPEGPFEWNDFQVGTSRQGLFDPVNTLPSGGGLFGALAATPGTPHTPGPGTINSVFGNAKNTNLAGGGLFGTPPTMPKTSSIFDTANKTRNTSTNFADTNAASRSSAPPLQKKKNMYTRGGGGFGSKKGPAGFSAFGGGGNASQDDDEEEEEEGVGEMEAVAEIDEMTLNPNRELDFQESSFEETGLTTTYDLPGVKTLVPSPTASKQRVARIQFSSVIFSHTVVAKYRPAAHLKAKMKNGSKITLLKGSTGLTLDGSFMGRTTLPRCSAGESFTLPLGVDPAIKVAYPKPDVHRITSGFFAKEESSIYTRSITVANTRAGAGKPVSVLVVDQVPVSEDEKLRIEILGPKGLTAGADGGSAVSTGMAMKDGEPRKDWGKATAQLKKGGEVVWEVSLNAGKAVKLALEYGVALPMGDKVVQC